MRETSKQSYPRRPRQAGFAVLFKRWRLLSAAVLVSAALSAPLLTTSANSESAAVPYLYSQWNEQADFTTPAHTPTFTRPPSETLVQHYDSFTQDIFSNTYNRVGTAARGFVLGSGAPTPADFTADFTEYLAARGTGDFDRLITEPLILSGETAIEGLPWVRDIDIRLESPVGPRQGNYGVGAVGTFRETDDQIMNWALRGYMAEDNAVGANAGVAFRAMTDGIMTGVNTFLDYEQTDLDGDFLRWGAGVEALGRLLDFHANIYRSLSEEVQSIQNGIAYRAYSASGWDAELAGRVPYEDWDAIEIAAKYYFWQGEGGDEDTRGIRYRIGYHPEPALRLGFEFDSGTTGGGNQDSPSAGFYISWRHQLWHNPVESLVRDDRVDPWARRYEPVKRENKQNIVKRVNRQPADTSEVFLADLTVGGIMLTLPTPVPGASYTYVVASTNPPGQADQIIINGAVASDNRLNSWISALTVADTGGTVIFDVQDKAGGAVPATVYFRDLRVDNLLDEGNLRRFTSDLVANQRMVTIVVAGGTGSGTYTYELAESTFDPGLVSLEDNGLAEIYIRDSGFVDRSLSGIAVVAITDADDVRIFATVRFGDMEFVDDNITVTMTEIRLVGGAIHTLSVTGGSGVTFALESTTPADAAASLGIRATDGAILDRGIRNAGVDQSATVHVTAVFSATDQHGFYLNATVRFIILDDLFIADFPEGNGTRNQQITPANAGQPLRTLVVSGGDTDTDYTYALESITSPGGGGYDYTTSVAITRDASGNGVITDLGNIIGGGGIANAGVDRNDNVEINAVFSVTDGAGQSATATISFMVLNVLALVETELNITVDRVGTSDGDALATIVANGGTSPYTYAIRTANPGGTSGSWFSNLAIDSNGVITDAGARLAGPATATVIFRVTDSGGSAAVEATVVIEAIGDLIPAPGSAPNIRINRLDAGQPIYTVAAVGGWPPLTYALVSTNPSSWRNSIALNTGNGVVTDISAASAGATVVTAVFSITDNRNDNLGGGDTTISTTVNIQVLDDITFNQTSVDLTIGPPQSAAGVNIYTLIATGGDSNFTYTRVDGPAAALTWRNQTTNPGVLVNQGAIQAYQAGGAGLVTLTYEVTDTSGLSASTTLYLRVVNTVVFTDSNAPLPVLISIQNQGNAFYTLPITEGATPYTYEQVGDFNPVSWNGLVSLNADTGELTENGVVAVGGGATAVYRVTDNLGQSDTATVHFTYNAVKFSARSSHAAAVHNDSKMYIVGGYDGSNYLADVWSSADGINWEEITSDGGFPVREGHSLESLGGTLYIVGGHNTANVRRDVWYSDDNGQTWTQKPQPAFSARFNHSSGVHNGTMYIVGGTSSREVAGSFTGTFFELGVWTSTDGDTWTAQNSGLQTRGSSGVEFLNGTLFVSHGRLLGDFSRQAWNIYSGDGGATWQRVNYSGTDPYNSPPDARSDISSVLFNNRMFFIGGTTDGNTGLSQVWSWNGGNDRGNPGGPYGDWTSEANLVFPDRLNHTSVVFNGRIYILGGDTGTTGGLNYLNDVWYSPDGTTWTQEN